MPAVTRNLGNIVMDVNDVEVVDVIALGGTDNLTVSDLTGTDVVKVDGGANEDTILGSQGSDVSLSGTGNDFMFGDNGNDVSFMGADDELLFGSNAAENVDIFPNGGRVIFFRNIANRHERSRAMSPGSLAFTMSSS